jgi:hypothetical protein
MKASFLMGVIEKLEVTSWLSDIDEEALVALESPLLKFEITQNLVNEFGDVTGKEIEIISIGVNKSNGKVYGKKASEASYFILTNETLLKLSIPLLDE